MNGSFGRATQSQNKRYDSIPSEIRTYGNWFKVIEPFGVENKLSYMYEHSIMITCLDLLCSERFKVINTLHCNVKVRHEY